jgi:hypothetical protein
MSWITRSPLTHSFVSDQAEDLASTFQVFFNFFFGWWGFGIGGPVEFSVNLA